MAATEPPESACAGEPAPASAPSEGAGLRALVAAALALPGMTAGAGAQDLSYNPDFRTLDNNTAVYLESDDRMTIFEDRVALSVPVHDRFRVTGSGFFTKITGASPFAVRPGTAETGPALCFEPIGSASVAGSPDCEGRVEIDDFRYAGELDLRYFGDGFTAGGTLGYSTEVDYISRYLSVDLSYELNEGRTVALAQFAYADDTVTRTFDDPDFEDDKSRIDFLLGVSHILTRNSLVQVNVSYANSSGFLTDPYKGVWVIGLPNLTQAERRPDERWHFALYGQYSHYLGSINSALHFDYRYTTDEWETDSHTFNAELRTNLGNGWQVAPSVRYYSQSDAFFYEPFFTFASLGTAFSSDYRLAAFGSISPALEVSKEFRFENQFVDAFRVRAYYHYTDRRLDYALTGGQGVSVDDYSVNVFGLSLESDF